MYNKSRNKLLFIIFILVVLIIITLLIISVYNAKNENLEEYKISPNNSVYDEKYSYVPLDKDSILKKEWDSKYYLYINGSTAKYSLGKNPVFYDKSRTQITIYGNAYQVFTNGDISKKETKTVISSLSDFQFFKLDDRKYLIIGEKIASSNFSTINYLIVSIDKAGNALLLNNDVDIKTINPLILSVNNIKFDIAHEKLLNGENEIDLKKINGSTNEYKDKTKEEQDKENSKNDNKEENNSTNNNTNNSINNGGSNSKIYNDIVNQIVNLTGIVNKTTNKTNLYKNISLRSVNPAASYIDIKYSIVDPENKYLSIFLSLKKGEDEAKYYYLDKNNSAYRINNLYPNTQYDISINYITRGSSQPIVADSITAFTSNDPTKVRIVKIDGNNMTYNIKMYNEYLFESANVELEDCDGNILSESPLNIQNALSSNGEFGTFNLNSSISCVYLRLGNVYDSSGNIVKVNSYHKVKIN